MKKIIFLPLLLVLFLAVPVQAGSWQQGDNVLIGDTSNDDIYSAGGSVNVQSPVTGDVYAAGGSIVINQSVSQDVVAVGGTVTLVGSVGDDARLAGGTITVNGPVSDDLVVAGGTITVNGDVGGDLIVAGGTVVVNGKVTGAIKAYAGSVTFNGTFFGPMEVHAETIMLNGTFNGSGRYVAAKLLSVQVGSTLNAPIEYYSPSGQQDLTQYLKNGATATFQSSLAPQVKPEVSKAWMARAFGWFELMTLLSAMLVIGLFVGLAGQYLTVVADDLRKHFWLRVGGGLVYFIVAPILALILIVTIIGLPLGILSLTIFILSLIFAKTLTATLLGAWLIQRTKKQWTGWRLWLVALGVYIILRLLVFIPVIGWLLIALVVCATFGVMLHYKFAMFRRGITK